MPSEAMVYVIDDDDAVRDSLAFLLESAEIAVRTYESATAFLDKLPPNGSGCIVTDVRMPGISGIDLLFQLRGMGVTLPVIVITGHADVPLAVEAMKGGAVDFIEKPFDDELLLSAVRTALRQHEKDVLREAEIREIQTRLNALSGRERQVLDGLVAGHPNKTIAFDLGISARTVEIYRANVMTKMQASSLSDLVRMALISGVLTGGTDRTRV
jgi:two-component system, LuxR family, response regulator FixJ